MIQKTYIFIFIFIFIILTSFYLIKNIFNNNNSNAGKKNLIVGYVFNYSWDTVRNYFISLVKAGFQNCDVVMFVKGMSEETLEKIKSCGVITYPIPENNNPYLTPNSHRWEVYANFLKENKDKYNMVFTTDIRDSIFQRDVFQFFDSSKSFFGVFLEDNIIGHSELMKKWVLPLSSEAEFNYFYYNKTVICAGTIIGTPDKFIEFYNVFLEVASKIKTPDQGILNYLVYRKNLFEDCLIIKDNNYYVMTIGKTNRSNIILDSNDNILNFKGEIAAAIHQYDKNQDIIDKMKIKFDDTNFNYSLYKEQIQNEMSTPNKINIKLYFIIIVIGIIICVIIYVFYIYKDNFTKNQEKFRKVKIKINNKKIRMKKHVYIK